MPRPNKKCICKKCDDCNFYIPWDAEFSDGLRKQVEECLFFVYAKELPKLRGAIDGLQGGVNEARNRSAESKEFILRFADATKQTMNEMGKEFVRTLKNIDRKMIGR